MFGSNHRAIPFIIVEHPLAGAPTIYWYAGRRLVSHEHETLIPARDRVSMNPPVASAGPGPAQQDEVRGTVVTVAAQLPVVPGSVGDLQ